jgi:hypothetical protein
LSLRSYVPGRDTLPTATNHFQSFFFTVLAVIVADSYFTQFSRQLAVILVDRVLAEVVRLA